MKRSGTTAAGRVQCRRDAHTLRPGTEIAPARADRFLGNLQDLAPRHAGIVPGPRLGPGACRREAPRAWKRPKRRTSNGIADCRFRIEHDGTERISRGLGDFAAVLLGGGAARRCADHHPPDQPDALQAYSLGSDGVSAQVAEAFAAEAHHRADDPRRPAFQRVGRRMQTDAPAGPARPDGRRRRVGA